MPRSPEPTRERLVAAAVDLFSSRGYAATTVDDIAAQAGVSPRTFFRHFPDKEEVLYADGDRLLPLVTETITAETRPVRAEDLMGRVLAGLAVAMEPERERLATRHRVVQGQVALMGRGLAKQARWQLAIADALTERGFAPRTSAVLAAVGFALYRGALDDWLADPGGPGLAELVAAAMPGLRQVLDEVSRPPGGDAGHLGSPGG